LGHGTDDARKRLRENLNETRFSNQFSSLLGGGDARPIRAANAIGSGAQLGGQAPSAQ